MASTFSIASASATAMSGFSPSGSTIARTHWPAIPEATKACASASGQQAGLDAHAALDQQRAEVEDALLALVGGDELGQLGPGGDQRPPSLGIRLDLGRGAQRDRDAGADRADGSDRRGTWRGLEGLATVGVVGVEVEDTRASVDGGTRLGGELIGGARDSGMVAIAVQGGLEEGHSAQRIAGDALAARHAGHEAAHQLGGL